MKIKIIIIIKNNKNKKTSVISDITFFKKKIKENDPLDIYLSDQKDPRNV